MPSLHVAVFVETPTPRQREMTKSPTLQAAAKAVRVTKETLAYICPPDYSCKAQIPSEAGSTKHPTPPPPSGCTLHWAASPSSLGGTPRGRSCTCELRDNRPTLMYPHILPPVAEDSAHGSTDRRSHQLLCPPRPGHCLFTTTLPPPPHPRWGGSEKKVVCLKSVSDFGAPLMCFISPPTNTCLMRGGWGIGRGWQCPPPPPRAVVRMPACHSRRFKGERPIGATTG